MQSTNYLFFELEYAVHGSLLNILNTKMNLTIDEIRIIVAQIIEAIFYMHSKGIVYGDLKAENILLTRDGLIKLCDFNLSGTSTILSDSFQGTAVYMAPEVIDGSEKTNKSDFWALGILIHLMFYRRYPFERKNRTNLFFNILNGRILPERNKKAPRSLRDLIIKLLYLRPRDRFGNNIGQFVNHPFFKKFDWENYKVNLKNFSLLKDIKDIINNQSKTEVIKNLQSNKDSLFQSQNPNFVYNLKDFSYDASEVITQKTEGN